MSNSREGRREMRIAHLRQYIRSVCSKNIVAKYDDLVHYCMMVWGCSHRISKEYVDLVIRFDDFKTENQTIILKRELEPIKEEVKEADINSILNAEQDLTEAKSQVTIDRETSLQVLEEPSS